MQTMFDGKKPAKLGTEKNPAVIKVQTQERLMEIQATFDEHGWHFIAELTPDEPEDITDMEILLNPTKTVIAETKVGRNDPCPCGSGKKYKKCCGQ
jgi:SWIM/SEC-C metal-binding protein